MIFRKSLHINELDESAKSSLMINPPPKALRTGDDWPVLGNLGRLAIAYVSRWIISRAMSAGVMPLMRLA